MADQFQKVAVHSLIKNGDRYLVTRRSQLNDWKPGEWDTPGGEVEFGELNPKEALAREVFEETGLKVRIGKLLHLYSSQSNPSRHQFQFVYECEYVDGEVKLNPEEHDEFRWVRPDEMEKMPLIAYLRSLYEEELKSLNYFR